MVVHWNAYQLGVHFSLDPSNHTTSIIYFILYNNSLANSGILLVRIDNNFSSSALFFAITVNYFFLSWIAFAFARIFSAYPDLFSWR